MKDIKWDYKLLDSFENGDFYVVNNSDYLSELFVGRFITSLDNSDFNYWWFDKGKFCYSNIVPKDLCYNVALTNLRKQYIVGIYEQVSYDYLEKVLENKVKSNQVVLTGKVKQESVAKYCGNYGVQVEGVESFDCQAWITTEDDDSLEEAREAGIKIKITPK